MTQTWKSSDYAESGRFVATMAGDVVEWLQARAGERILDLGCGDGFLTERITRETGALVVGVDSSPSMVAAARARGLQAEQMDGAALNVDGAFDAVFSNAALHWMPDQRAVLAGVRRALRPGGRFVAEMGGHGNVAAIRTALRAVCAPLGVDAEGAGSNFFFTVEEYTALLEESGFAVEQIALAPRPTPLPTGMAGWLQTFRRGLLDALPEARRDAVVEEVVELLRPILCDSRGQWTADYVRLRFRAVVKGV